MVPISPAGALGMNNNQLNYLREMEIKIDVKIKNNYTGRPFKINLAEVCEKELVDEDKKIVLDRLVNDYVQAGWEAEIKTIGEEGRSNYLLLAENPEELDFYSASFIG